MRHPFYGWQERADRAPVFVNVVFSILFCIAGFIIGIVYGGRGLQYALAILSALAGFYFIKLFVRFFRFALALLIFSAIYWAVIFLYSRFHP